MLNEIKLRKTSYLVKLNWKLQYDFLVIPLCPKLIVATSLQALQNELKSEEERVAQMEDNENDENEESEYNEEEVEEEVNLRLFLLTFYIDAACHWDPFGLKQVA